MSAPYYTSNDPNTFIPQETHQTAPPYAYGGQTSVASSQFTAPVGGGPSTSVPEIEAEDDIPSTSVPPQEPAEKKTKRQPEYSQWWVSWYNVTYLEDRTMQYLECKVKDCKKIIFEYKKQTGMSSFKRHAEMHQRKSERPSERAGPRQIQTLVNPDDTRTNPKYDE